MIRPFITAVIAACTICGAFLSANDNIKADKLSAEELAKLSEAFGHLIGKNIGNSKGGIHLDIDKVIIGIREGSQGKPSPLSDEEVEQLMTRLQIQAFMEMSTNNLKEANEFMEKNTKEKDIVVVDQKLHYTILKPGAEAEVMEGDAPEIFYTGKLLSGEIFDSTDGQGESVVIPLNQTIPGFRKGIIGMHEGEKRRLFIHPDLGYGTAGQLPPNSLLIFDIEVVKANAGKGDQINDEDDEDLEDEDFALELDETDFEE